MKSKKNYKIQQARGKRKKRKKKSSDGESVASSDCDSDLKLIISHKRLKSNETNEINETSDNNSQHEETLDFNETIEHCLNQFKESSNQVKPPEPTIKKKEKPPRINYVLLNNVAKVNKVNKPAFDSIYDDIDDDDDDADADDDDDHQHHQRHPTYADDDYDAVDYDDYLFIQKDHDDYDDYLGIEEVDDDYCTNATTAQLIEAQRVVSESMKRYHRSTDNIVSNSISSSTIPLATPSSSTQRTLYEETPLQKVSKVAFPAQFVAGRRQVTRSNKRKRILPGPSVSPKQSNSFTSIPSSDLETVNDNEMTPGRDCQDCNPNEQRRSNRKSIPTEKFASYKESVEPKQSKSSTSITSSHKETVITDNEICHDNYRVPKSARYAFIAQESADRKQRRHAQADKCHAQADNHYTRKKINGLFTTLEGVWDKECPHCGYMHLDCATPHMLSNCCFNGKLSPWDNDADEMYSRYAYLEPLSKELSEYIKDNIENIGRLSAAYNSVLSICRIGVENGNRETGARNTHEGGFELRLGDHAFVIGGRMYHCTPKRIDNTDPSCELMYY